MIQITGKILLEFCPIFHSESTDRNPSYNADKRHLKKRNESSKQRDEDHHTTNQSTAILDEHKNLRSNLYSINVIAVPGGMLHHGNKNTIVFRLKF